MKFIEFDTSKPSDYVEKEDYLSLFHIGNLKDSPIQINFKNWSVLLDKYRYWSKIPRMCAIIEVLSLLATEMGLDVKCKDPLSYSGFLLATQFDSRFRVNMFAELFNYSTNYDKIFLYLSENKLPLPKTFLEAVKVSTFRGQEPYLELLLERHPNLIIDDSDIYKDLNVANDYISKMQNEVGGYIDSCFQIQSMF